MDRARMIMGSEVEYSLISGPGRERGQWSALRALLEALPAVVQVACDLGNSAGCFLENGGRAMPDTGAHPEYATPEVDNPRDAAIYDKAGELIFSRALASALSAARHARDPVRLHKANVSVVAPSAATWANHESYLLWTGLDPARDALMPHLVTRSLYAGAGCLGSRSRIRPFRMSQRMLHINQVSNDNTMAQRGLFCTRERPSTDSSQAGWRRLHLITKDSQRSPYAIYLTMGVTALLVHLLNIGRPVGLSLALEDPLRAAKDVARDMTLSARVRLVDGRRLTALEIQEALLTECEVQLQAGDDTGWGREVVVHWRATLEGLRRDPKSLADRLDIWCKWSLYSALIERERLTWSVVARGLHLLSNLRVNLDAEVVAAILSNDSAPLKGANRAKFRIVMRELKARADMLPSMQCAARLQQLEQSYHEVGDGLYDRLESQGAIRWVIAKPEDVERAVHEPPNGTRAAVRGALIKQRGAALKVDWTRVFDFNARKQIALLDPFLSDISMVSEMTVNEGDPLADSNDAAHPLLHTDILQRARSLQRLAALRRLSTREGRGAVE